MRPGEVVLCLSIAAALCTGGQDEADSRLRLLMRVHEKTGKSMARIPNYTCTESISRSVLSANPPRLEYMDRLRLDVAVIQGKEMFSWAGAARFQSDDVLDVTGTGPIGSGDFASFAHTVFVSDAPTYDYGEEEMREGRPAIRYNYRVAVGKSGYEIRSGRGHAIVGYHGSFWVDRTEERVLALEVHADEIPEELDLSEAKTLIEYRPARLGEEEFLLPRSSELTAIKRRTGQVTRIRIEFGGCQKFTAESAIRFGEGGPAGTAGGTSSQALALPAGVRFDVTLDSSIDIGSASAGDAISATLVRPVRAGSLEIPAGAKLLGRVLRFEVNVQELNAMLALDFDELEFRGRRVAFSGRLRESERLRGLKGASLTSLQSISAGTLAMARAQQWRDPAVFTLTENRTQIPAGFRMRWETVRRASLRR